MSQLTVPELHGLSAEQQVIVTEILKDIQTSVERLARAARRWVELPEKVRGKIVEQTAPSFREFWKRLEAVGLGSLHPQLATIGGRAARLLGKLPLDEQGKYLQERLPLVVARGRGWDLRLVDVAEMTNDQKTQVFKVGPDGAVTVRSEEAQKKWLADRAAKRLLEKAQGEALKKVERAGWKVEMGRVWVKPHLVEQGLTRAQVERMLKDLE